MHIASDRKNAQKQKPLAITGREVDWMIEELAWLGLGMAAGIGAGLVPGIHANTIAFMSLYLPLERGTGFGLFIVAMSITNAFVDAVPSVLLGAPSEENIAAMLPGHEMLMEGRGIEAVMLIVSGALCSSMITIALMPLFFVFATRYEGALPILVPVLASLSFFAMALSEKKKIHALLLATLCGALGVIALGKIDNAIFVLITGFFGVTGLLESIRSNANLPPQQENVSGKAEIGIPLAAAAVSGFSALLPGIGPTQATVMAKGVVGGIGRRKYLLLCGGIGVGNLVFSLLMLFAVQKGRSGMTVALQNFIGQDWETFLTLLAGACIAAGLSALVCGKIAKIAARKIRLFDYRKISALALAFMVVLVAASSGPPGLLACAAAAALAMFGISAGVRRSQCMSFLLVPTILFYLGIRI